MYLNRSDLSIYERAWFNALLSRNFPERELVIQQINVAVLKREYTAHHLFLHFVVDRSVPSILTSRRTAIEMCAYKECEIPAVFVLHIIDGYIAWLEVFHGDSSEISCNLDISGARLDFIAV